MHPGRVFGHPLLIAFLRQLAKKVRALGLGALSLGDLGQPRGGPAPTGHASHQTGLDVDVWYTLAPHDKPVPMVDKVAQKVTTAFAAQVARVLELAAGDPRVDRIFVNPVIKRELCATARGEREWLHKLRPWWGHDEHFHVRLACPPDSPTCQPQPAYPTGDGCAEVAWWFNAAAQKERDDRHQTYRSKVGAAPPLPPECAALVADLEGPPGAAPPGSP
jgi:penicillin-insensitive murein endopeptidase